MVHKREKLVVGNWKLNGSPELALAFDKFFSQQQYKSVSVSICPPYTFFPFLQSVNYSLGAQDVSANCSGAYTGEVSAQMLKQAGVQLVIVGHSERREHHG